MEPRLRERYRTEIVPAMREQFKYKNVMQVPRLVKIVVDMGVGDAQTDARMMEAAIAELAQITGQKASIRKARRSIAGFKVRAGAQIACMVTLRGHRMYEFMDRLLNIAIPRVRDFRGFLKTSFDKDGNYTVGIREQAIFPEINVDKVLRVRGMNVTFVMNNVSSAEESQELLRRFGVPFRMT